MRLIHYLIFPFLAIIFILTTLISWALSVLPKGRNRRFHRFLYQFWSKAFYWMFWFDETTHHRHQKPLPRQYILISNHYSGVDTIWLPGKFKVIPLSKDDISKWPMIGKILKAAGMIFVNRKENRSKIQSLDRIKQTLDKGISVLIFPEGGCHGRYLADFKDGAFAMSMNTGVPILPAYLFYEEEDTYELRKSEGLDYMLQCLFSRNNRKVHSYIFDAVYPTDFSSVAEYKAYVLKIYQDIQQEVKGSPSSAYLAV